MDKTEFIERLKRSAQLQAEQKRQKQERFKDLMEKLKMTEAT